MNEKDATGHFRKILFLDPGDKCVDFMTSLRALTNDARKTIKRFFAVEGIVTGLRIIVRSGDAGRYNELFVSEVIRKRWTRLGDVFEFQGEFAVNPQAQPGHDLCIQIYRNIVILNMPTEVYQRFGVKGTKEAGHYSVIVDKGNEKGLKRAQECAYAWDTGVFGSPINDTFFICTGRKVGYKSRQTFVDAEFTITDPVEFADALGHALLAKDGDSVMHSFDGCYFSSEEIGDLMDLNGSFILVCKKIHEERTIILVNNPNELMWTLHLEQ